MRKMTVWSLISPCVQEAVTDKNYEFFYLWAHYGNSLQF